MLDSIKAIWLFVYVPRFSEALEKCSGEYGGHLATFETTKEWQAVVDLMFGRETKNGGIGDEENEGVVPRYYHSESL